MKNIFLFFLFVFSFHVQILAQQIDVEINRTSNQLYHLNLNQLLQFQVLNQKEDIQVSLQIDISKQGEGRVAVLRTDQTTLKKGIHFSSTLLGPNGIRLEVVNAREGFRGILQRNFNFPGGKYTYCVEVLNSERVILAKNCSTFEKLNAQDILLIYPFNEQELEEQFPVFNWTNVNPQNSNNITYRIKWIESEKPFIKKRKNIQYENEFFIFNTATKNYLSYELSFPSFDKNKFYYWQVQALDGLNVIATSEVWEFSFKKLRPSSKSSIYYVNVNLETSDKLHVFSGNNLNFQWENVYNVSEPKLKILSESGEVVLSKENNPAAVKLPSGNSFFQLDLSSFVKTNEVYTLIVSDETKEYKIKFKQTL